MDVKPSETVVIAANRFLTEWDKGPSNWAAAAAAVDDLRQAVTTATPGPEVSPLREALKPAAAGPVRVLPTHPEYIPTEDLRKHYQLVLGVKEEKVLVAQLALPIYLANMSGRGAGHEPEVRKAAVRQAKELLREAGLRFEKGDGDSR